MTTREIANKESGRDENLGKRATRGIDLKGKGIKKAPPGGWQGFQCSIFRKNEVSIVDY